MQSLGGTNTACFWPQDEWRRTCFHGHPFVFRKESEVRQAPTVWVLVEHKHTQEPGSKANTFTSSWSGSTCMSKWSLGFIISVAWDLSLLTGAQADSLSRLANSKGGIGFGGSRCCKPRGQHGGCKPCGPVWRCLNCSLTEKVACSFSQVVGTVGEERLPKKH